MSLPKQTPSLSYLSIIHYATLLKDNHIYPSHFSSCCSKSEKKFIFLDSYGISVLILPKQ